ncbi:hypothetical protein CLV84_0897 [Neolewinella xylanilytica]|uniref:Uncharacterized protein n=1 Tax=Neolewinella xylanilytica TaxID=1514080 RepID=A0A2S6I8Y2_9BACT|nr:hypothetical protein [Neolewinella xylanilytica]PPK87938.1 hypothetical protein CLV84_0897 [Neolewinella xylanilytica]
MSPSRFPIHLCTCALAALLLSACGSTYPPRKFRLPERLSEASGLVIDDNRMLWHNDSGDGPYLYTTDIHGELLAVDTLAADAVDYEDICQDDTGRLYLGDFGNNTGRRPDQTIYRYDSTTGVTDSIVFTYPGQDGRGIDYPGNYNCEAMVVADGQLHLFTKDVLSGNRPFYIKHFRLPAQPGTYEAELVDSLYLPRRVITGATLDRQRNELYLVAYNFRVLLGFLPTGAASLIKLSNYPEGAFFRGDIERRNVAWAVPTQHEAVAIYNDAYLYIAAEATRIRKRAIARRIKR